ncbi:transposase [Rhizobium laguerreae]|uniref:transposase n=1 Tax=Rhizobium laguerreae TaxID=1076926 RepID=UPI001C91FF70|nr:transposase [Rhizobium laguerreae]MBY3488075.1 transposase [Rhizobium laguerreae]
MPINGQRAERGAEDQALRRSRGGLTTKIRILADAVGRPLRFIVTAGQVGDITQASALLKGQTDQAVLGDKAYDSNPCAQQLRRWRPRRSYPQTLPER